MDVKFLNIRHLRVFLEVARCHSISLAAGKTHLSQPAVTQAVSKLEADLKVALFERRKLGFYTTEIGRKFVARVERALQFLHTGARQSYRHKGDQKSRGFSNFDELVTAAQLRALVAVGEAHSYSVAGRQIGLSQPSVHRSVSNLENLAGLEFFQRTSSGIDPTPAGRAFIFHTKLAYAEIRQGLSEIAEFLGRDTTEINLGSLPLARSRLLPTAVHAMIDSSERVQVRIVDGPYLELLRGLRNGDLDCMVGALRDPLPAEDIVQETLFEDPLQIVAGSNHPLVKKESVTIEDTLKFPWAAAPKGTPGGTYLFDTLKIDSLKETPVRVVSSSLVFLRGLLSKGEYLTVISKQQIEDEVQRGSLVPLPVPLQNNSRPIGLTTRRNWHPTATQEKFIELLRKYGREG